MGYARQVAEMVVESRRTPVIRMPGSSVHTWCVKCASEVMTVTPEKAAALAFTNLRAIYLWAELGTIHCIRTTEGRILICLNSL